MPIVPEDVLPTVDGHTVSHRSGLLCPRAVLPFVVACHCAEAVGDGTAEEQYCELKRGSHLAAEIKTMDPVTMVRSPMANSPKAQRTSPMEANTAPMITSAFICDRGSFLSEQSYR